MEFNELYPNRIEQYIPKNYRYANLIKILDNPTFYPRARLQELKNVVY